MQVLIAGLPFAKAEQASSFEHDVVVEEIVIIAGTAMASTCMPCKEPKGVTDEKRR